MPDLTTGTQLSERYYDPVPDATLGLGPTKELRTRRNWSVFEIDLAVCETNPNGVFASDAECEFVADFSEELVSLPIELRESPAATLCREFLGSTGLLLAKKAGLRWAVFADEEDGLELLVHSHATRRQISFEFSVNGQNIEVVQLDENLRRSTYSLLLKHRLQLSQALEWLQPEIPKLYSGFVTSPNVVQSYKPVPSADELNASKFFCATESNQAFSVDQRLRELDSWISSHIPLDYEVDDSRESIYEGRGE